MPSFIFFTLIFATTSFCGFSVVLTQQPYIGLAATACLRKGNLDAIRGYNCNGVNRRCQAYITFRSQPLYSSVSTISSLLGAVPSEVAGLNSVSQNATFEANHLVLVPTNCSCSGQYYQANTSYIVQNTDTPFLIANNTFDGLSTCQALLDQNELPGGQMPLGATFNIPLRCACPTKNQNDKGVKYLLSYLVTWGDSISAIARKFGVGTNITLEANSLSYEKSTIYPFTTLLVPLQSPPSNFSQTGEPSPPPSPQSRPTSSDEGSNRTWVYVVVGVVGGIALILVLGAIIFWWRHWKIKKKEVSSVIVSESFEAIEKPEGKKVEEKSEELPEIISGIAQSLKVYEFEELKHATDNFSPNSRIKGSVYRGVIHGDFAAIKKMEGDITKEIEILSKVNHSNIIRLSGISFNEGQWYLVYEYAANGALSDWIYFNKIDGKFLTWTQRMQIALDVATGTDYLHSFTSPPHVHKDLRSGNIYLDSDFRAKIANLGHSRSLEGEDDKFPMTRHIFGTRGYMAPEYLENGLVSTKLDVYTFGLLVLEILTGKEVSAICTEDKKDLSDVLRDAVGEGSGQKELMDFIDPSLKGNYPLEFAMYLVKLIDNCIKKDLLTRPGMHEIVPSLSRILDSSLTWETSVNVSRNQNFSASS